MNRLSRAGRAGAVAFEQQQAQLQLANAAAQRERDDESGERGHDDQERDQSDQGFHRKASRRP